MTNNEFKISRVHRAVERAMALNPEVDGDAPVGAIVILIEEDGSYSVGFGHLSPPAGVAGLLRQAAEQFDPSAVEWSVKS